VFRDRESWRNAWMTRTFDGHSSAVPPPEVNFEEDLVVGVSLGMAATASDSLQPVEVTREGSTVKVVYRRVSSGGLGPAVMVPLNLFLAIPRPADSVEFVAIQ
jgi:hypothetical protein